MPRKLRSVIDSYVNSLALTTSPDAWKEWAGLWLVGAAVERQTWCVTMEDRIFPNLFVFLVGKSGGGKSLALNRARRLLNGLGSDRTTASSMTAAYFAQCLMDNKRTFINPETKIGETYNAANVITTELQTLFIEADKDMIGKLTDLYDCGEFSEGRRDEKKTFDVKQTFCAMLGATTMSQLMETFDEGMWQQGFMSRVIMIYGEPGKRKSLFRKQDSDIPHATALERDMLHDLKIIAKQVGEFQFTQEAAVALDEFFTYETESGLQLGGPPIPEHPQLITYCARRHLHLEKMMIIYALDEGVDFITLEHYEKAHKLLLNTEANMNHIFKASGAKSDMSLVNHLLHEATQIYVNQDQKPLQEAQILSILLTRTTSWQARQLVETVCLSNKLKKLGASEKKTGGLNPGLNYYIPLAATFDE